MTRRSFILVAFFLAVGFFFSPSSAQAERRHRRARAEVVAWAADGSIVVFSEPNRRDRRRRDLVARRVSSGEIIARVRVFPGPCARRIEGRVAVSHACALAQIRPRLSARDQRKQFHVAATSRDRITAILLRSDGSVVEHELPRIGVVLRGRTERRDDRMVAVLEALPMNGHGAPQILDRRPIRPRVRRRWTLLQAGDHRYILLGKGVLRLLRPRNGRRAAHDRPRGDASSPGHD